MLDIGSWHVPFISVRAMLGIPLFLMQHDRVLIYFDIHCVLCLLAYSPAFDAVRHIVGP